MYGGEFQKPTTIGQMRNEFKKETGNIAVSHKGKCTFEYFQYLEELALEYLNKDIYNSYSNMGDDL